MNYEEMMGDYFDANPEMKKHLDNGCDVDWEEGFVVDCGCNE